MATSPPRGGAPRRAASRADVGATPGRPLPARRVPLPAWTGNRESWLLALRQDLSAHWCAVRTGSPHDSWDLELGVGPVLRCRLNAAVLWGWDPLARRTWALSRSGAVGLVVCTLAATVLPGDGLAAAGAVFLSALVVSAVVEAVVLARLSSGAIARTTRAAHVP